MAEVVERAQGCFPCHLSGRAVVAAPLGILRDYVQAALLVHAPPPPPQDTAWLPFPSNLEYAAAPPLTQDPAPYSSGLHPPTPPMLEAPPHTVVLLSHRDPASTAVPPHTTAPPPHFRAAPAGALGPGLQGSGLPAQGSACGRCGRCRRRRKSLPGSGWSLLPEWAGESEQRVLAALCGLPRAASRPRVAEPSPPPRWGPLRAAPPPWPAR